MANLGKTISTLAVWGGVVVLSYMFNSFGILSGGGAGVMVFVAFLVTLGIWVD